MSNRLTLINALHAAPVFDGHFRNLSVANCDPNTGDQLPGGGGLSVVFKATDSRTGSNVAIKFFDPSVGATIHSFRYELFSREATLLSSVTGRPRILQLLQEERQFDLTVRDRATGAQLTIPCFYFVTEWLEQGVLHVFAGQDNLHAEEKLRLFRDMLLAVASLHNAGIFHRDLKHDNLRLADREGRKLIAAIDLGTAVSLDSQRAGNVGDYGRPVGADLMAPPEAICGLASVRKLAPSIDYYALGELLHDLFFPQFFCVRRTHDRSFGSFLGVCSNQVRLAIGRRVGEEQLLAEWCHIVGLSKRMVPPILLDERFTSAPISIRGHLDHLIATLTNVDFRDRESDLHRVLRKIDGMLKILRNSLSEREAQKRRAIFRQRKLAKIQRRNQRTAQELSSLSARGDMQ